MNIPGWLRVAEEVRRTVAAGGPVVVLESTVLAQGLPQPLNLEVGRLLEASIRERGAVPATVAVIDGVPTIGLSAGELVRIATDEEVQKLSSRDIPLAMAAGATGATTVAGTAWLAARAGIEIFATGGVGGVHRGLPTDISADLYELQRTPMLVVCAGAKSILDLPATRELLETLGVPVLGWRTDSFPAFYSTTSALPVDVRVETIAQAAEIWRAHRRLEAEGGVLLCAPIPPAAALDPVELERVIAAALVDAGEGGIRGKEITPYLLQVVARVTEGRSLDANVALLRNNAEIAAELAVEVADG